MDTLLNFCDLRGPPKPSLRTSQGSMDPRLKTYALAPFSLTLLLRISYIAKALLKKISF